MNALHYLFFEKNSLFGSFGKFMLFVLNGVYSVMFHVLDQENKKLQEVS